MAQLALLSIAKDCTLSGDTQYEVNITPRKDGGLNIIFHLPCGKRTVSVLPNHQTFKAQTKTYTEPDRYVWDGTKFTCQKQLPESYFSREHTQKGFIEEDTQAYVLAGSLLQSILVTYSDPQLISFSFSFEVAEDAIDETLCNRFRIELDIPQARLFLSLNRA